MKLPLGSPIASPTGTARTKRIRHRAAAVLAATVAATAVMVATPMPAFAAATINCTIPLGNHYDCQTGVIWANPSTHALFVTVFGSSLSSTNCKIYDYDNWQQVANISASAWTAKDKTINGLYNRYIATCRGSSGGGISMTN